MLFRSNPNRRATGTIIESSLDKGRGYVSTVLVANGTLKVGDIVLAGTSWGRVKAMFTERNANIKSAAPAEPAIILGLNGAPTAGDQFHVIETEQEAREIANKREQLQREQGLRTQKRLTLGDISHRIARGEFHDGEACRHCCLSYQVSACRRRTPPCIEPTATTGRNPPKPCSISIKSRNR